MKTEEDEAFDDLARRQGMWGGGFPAKRAMAADKYSDIASDGGLDPRNQFDAQPTHCQCHACKDGVLHASDCAVHTGPAYSLGPCDCGVEKGQEEDWGALAEKQLASIKRDTQASFEDEMVRATHKVMIEDDDDIQVYKKPWVGLTDEEIDKTYWAMPRINKPQPTQFEFARAIEQLLKEKNA